MDINIKPWHRQPQETAKAFHAFMLYRDMLPRERSLQKVCQRYAKGAPYLTHLKRWSSRYHWVARASAHDDHLAAVRADAQEHAIKEMADRQAKQGMALQGVGIRRFVNPDGSLNVNVASMMQDKDAIRAVDVGAKLERTARGEPTEIVKKETTIRTAKDLTDDELAQIIQEEREKNGSSES